MEKYLCFILLISLFSCNKWKSGKEIYVINPENFPDDQFTFSDIADDISYVPLDDTLTIGLIYSIKITPNSIYISTQNLGILLFDKEGNFIRIIAGKGRGPGELTSGVHFAVDEKNENVYALEDDKVKVYSREGSFINNFSTKEYFVGRANDIEKLGPYLFFPDYGTYGEFKNKWVILDTLGNFITVKENSIHSQGFMVPGNIYKFQDKLFYSNCLDDTIFSISSDLKVQAAYLFAKGNFRWPKDFVSTIESIYNTFRCGSMFETKHFIFIEYGYRNISAILKIDKRTKDIYQGYEKHQKGIVDHTPFILNDLDGGIPYRSEPTNFYYYNENDREYIINIINPFELKDRIASDDFKNSTPKYPEKKKALEQLANSLDENDNPVLMLLKLKE